MRIQDLKRWKEAPESGMMLAYTRKNVIYRQYRRLEEAANALSGQELLEIHLFNDLKEYRSIVTRSPRYPDGVIEAVIDFPKEDKRSVFEETAYLENGRGTITVLNHLKYSDANGMMTVDNYRLKRGEA